MVYRRIYEIETGIFEKRRCFRDIGNLMCRIKSYIGNLMRRDKMVGNFVTKIDR